MCKLSLPVQVCLRKKKKDCNQTTLLGQEPYWAASVR